MIILQKKGDMKDIQIYRPTSLLSSMYNLHIRISTKKKKKKKKGMAKVLDENQSRKQADFTKKRVTQPLIIFKQSINCIGYIDNEKAFDSIEHEAIFKALRLIGINKTYITISRRYLHRSHCNCTYG